MEPFLAGVYLVAFNFAPVGYALCNGQIIAISQNTALFSLVGTYYGGNGTSNFQLPDLQGRIPIHQGQGSGLSPYTVGQLGGTEIVTLNANQLPPHSHTFNVSSAAGTTGTPGTTTYLSRGPATGSGPNASVEKTYTTTAPDTSLSPASISGGGGSQPFSIIQPYLTMTYIIAMQGVFPARN